MYDKTTLRFGGSCWVVWQEADSNGNAEEALTITRYNGTIAIQQRDSTITIGDAAMPEVLKLLREALRHKIEDQP